MNILHHKTIVGFIGMLVLLLLLAALPGCQPAAETSAGTVLAEGECTFEFPEYNERSDLSVDQEEPVYGDVNRGEVVIGSMHCPGLWDHAGFVGVQDFLNADWYEVGDTVNPKEWNGYIEYIPDDGGAWSGWTHADDWTTVYQTLEGDGELEGRRLEIEGNLETSKAKYRIVQVGDTPVAETPEAAGTVLAEGETVCEYTVSEVIEGLKREEPGYGEVDRGGILVGVMDCPGMFENARFILLNTLIAGGSESSLPTEWNAFLEFITDDGGAWRGTSHIVDNINNTTLKGEGVHEGKRMEYGLNPVTGEATYRIIQVSEQ